MGNNGKCRLHLNEMQPAFFKVFRYIGIDFSYINIYGTGFHKYRDQCP